MINNFFVTTELFIRNKDDIYMKIGCLFRGCRLILRIQYL